MQTLAVIILVALATFFLLRRFLGFFRTGQSPCGRCSLNDSCGEQQRKDGVQLQDHRKDSPDERT